MSEHRNSKRTAFVPIVVAFLLIFTYVAAYLILVKPTDPGFKTFGRPYPRWANYGRATSSEASILFWPINWIDRRIRPDMWTTH